MPSPLHKLQDKTSDLSFQSNRRHWLRQLMAGPFAAPLAKSGAISMATMLLTACGGGSRTVDLSFERPDYQPLIEEISAALRGQLASDELKGSGISIALIDGANIVWSSGFGYSHASAKLAASPTTRYEAGSVTKLFTATAVMQLVEKGLVDLDSPIERYIPGFRIRSRWDLVQTPITPRLLLAHRAGIPEELLVGGFATRSRTLAETISLLVDEELAYRPGALTAYSNMGYQVLGRLIECVSGVSYTQYIEQHILQPLGMKSSSMTSFSTQSPAGIALADAVGYPGPDNVAPQWLDNGVAEGGLRSSVADLARFVNACLQIHAGKQASGFPLRAASLAEMWKPQFTGEPLDLDFELGLAWHCVPLMRDAATQKTLHAVMHGGTSMHHRSMLALLPEQGIGAVVMGNHSASEDVVTEAALQVLVRAAAIKHRLELQPLGSPVPPRFTQTADLRRYEGFYALRDGPVVRLREKDGALVAELEGKSAGLLVPAADGFFWAHAEDSEAERVAFDQIRGLELLVRYADDGRRRLFATRLTTLSPVSSEWRARLGTYTVLPGLQREIIQSARLYLEEEILRLEISAPTFSVTSRQLGLAPDSANTALVLGLGRGRRETVRAGRDGRGDFLKVQGITLHRALAVV